MNALSGTTTGVFDEILVRNPSFTGGYQNVLSILGGASFADSALQSSIDANSSSISSLSSTTAESLATKRNVSYSYGVDQLDTLLEAKSVPQLDAEISTLNDSVVSRLTGGIGQSRSLYVI